MPHRLMPVRLPLHLIQRGELERDHFFRKRRVSELGRKLLSVGERPANEVAHDLRALFVLWRFVEEQPRE